MKYLFLFLFLFCSCLKNKNTSNVDGVVARVGETTLTEEDLFFLIEKKEIGGYGVSRYVQNWVEKELAYLAAKKSGLLRDSGLRKKKDEYYKNLLVSSFLDIEKKNKITISRKEVSDYYIKNKASFVRSDDQMIVRSFFLKTKKEAFKVKKSIKNNKDGRKFEDLVKKHKPTLKTITKRYLINSPLSFLFTAELGDVVGPKKNKDFYGVYEIVRVYKKGTTMGLEAVYDEIYQRIYKTKEKFLVKKTLDSLFVNSDVFISGNYK